MAHRASLPAREADREICARARTCVAVEGGGTSGSKGHKSYGGHSPYGGSERVDAEGMVYDSGYRAVWLTKPCKVSRLCAHRISSGVQRGRPSAPDISRTGPRRSPVMSSGSQRSCTALCSIWLSRKHVRSESKTLSALDFCRLLRHAGASRFATRASPSYVLCTPLPKHRSLLGHHAARASGQMPAIRSCCTLR